MATCCQKVWVPVVLQGDGVPVGCSVHVCNASVGRALDSDVDIEERPKS